MVINRLQKSILDNALNQYAMTHSYIRIQQTNGGCMKQDEEPVYFGVNWGAWGAQDVDSALTFSAHLMKSIELAMTLNEISFVVDYVTEPKGIELNNKCGLVKELAVLLELDDGERIADFLAKYDRVTEV